MSVANEGDAVTMSDESFWMLMWAAQAAVFWGSWFTKVGCT